MFRNFFTHINSPSAVRERAADRPLPVYPSQPAVPPFAWYVNKAIHGECIDVLGRFLGGQGTVNVPCWSPDGRRIAFVTYQLVP